MSQFTIEHQEKQLSEKFFKPNKAFKIKDNNTIVLYALKPYISETTVQIASAEVIAKSDTEFLISVISCLCANTYEDNSREMKKRNFVLFRDPYKGGKLIWKRVPFGIMGISEALTWL